MFIPSFFPSQSCNGFCILMCFFQGITAFVSFRIPLLHWKIATLKSALCLRNWHFLWSLINFLNIFLECIFQNVDMCKTVYIHRNSFFFFWNMEGLEIQEPRSWHTKLLNQTCNLKISRKPIFSGMKLGFSELSNT